MSFLYSTNMKNGFVAILLITVFLLCEKSFAQVLICKGVEQQTTRIARQPEIYSSDPKTITIDLNKIRNDKSCFFTEQVIRCSRKSKEKDYNWFQSDTINRISGTVDRLSITDSMDAGVAIISTFSFTGMCQVSSGKPKF